MTMLLKDVCIHGNNNSRHKLTVKNGMERPEANTGEDEGCCTVIIQVTSVHNVVAFRRDAKFSAELLITRNNFHGKDAEIQYKVDGGLFYHTVITSDGWMLASGGVGTTPNQELMKLAGQILENGAINPDSMQEARSILINMGVGHLLIKSPDNCVGLVVTCRGTTLNKMFKMQDGTFISVPNAPQFYREGNYSEFNSDPLTAAAEIVGTDLWGVNRRNVTFHEVQTKASNTKLQIWASFDDGSLINRNTEGGPDDVRFLGSQITRGKDLPIIPSMTRIGEIELNGNEAE